MPNGKTHAILTIITSSTLFSATNYFEFPLQTSLFLAIGSLIGLILTPDLDQAESHRGLWKRIWWIYGRMFSHRSFLSHFPVISTIIRLLYIFSIPAFIIWWYVNIPESYLHLILIIIIGLIASDTIHYIADILTSEIKRIF